MQTRSSTRDAPVLGIMSLARYGSGVSILCQLNHEWGGNISHSSCFTSHAELRVPCVPRFTDPPPHTPRLLLCASKAAQRRFHHCQWGALCGVNHHTDIASDKERFEFETLCVPSRPASTYVDPPFSRVWGKWVPDNPDGTRPPLSSYSFIELSPTVARTLVCLSLNRLHAIDDDDVISLSSVLSRSALKVLELECNLVGDKGAEAIANLLKVTRLEQLRLSGNPIEIRGVVAIGEALGLNDSLTHLKLGPCYAGDEGATAIASSLAHHPTLSSLELNSSKIGPPGAVALAAAVEHNRSLVRLSLYNNCIEDEGGIAFARALNKAETLRYLYLCNNFLTPTGMEAIIVSVVEAKKLYFLDSNYWPIPSLLSMRVNKVCRENCNLDNVVWDGEPDYNHIDPIFSLN
eukprot:GHVN01077442.1.p1 GENE.GHVN01077442.1~~GHVN01077442.1.p1  ORF type:complete len:405 (-),score=58.61 GHVN01077442.1:69-1283(-)